MSLESAPSPNTRTTQSPIPCAKALSDAFAAPNLETPECHAPNPEQLTLDGSQPELMTLQSKAIRSIEICQQKVADLVDALGAHDKRRRHLTRSITDRASFVDRDTTALEAFFISAKNLILSLSDPENSKSESRPDLQTAEGKFRDDDLKARLGRLTERQKRVFRLVAQGLPNKMIAYELGITETTVKTHVSGILRKLGVSSRARAIVLFGKLKA